MWSSLWECLGHLPWCMWCRSRPAAVLFIASPSAIRTCSLCSWWTWKPVGKMLSTYQHAWCLASSTCSFPLQDRICRHACVGKRPRCSPLLDNNILSVKGQKRCFCACFVQKLCWKTVAHVHISDLTVFVLASFLVSGWCGLFCVWWLQASMSYPWVHWGFKFGRVCIHYIPPLFLILTAKYLGPRTKVQNLKSHENPKVGSSTRMRP